MGSRETVGTSLLEVVIALALIAVALLGLGAALGSSARRAAIAQRLDQAVALARSAAHAPTTGSNPGSPSIAAGSADAGATAPCRVQEADLAQSVDWRLLVVECVGVADRAANPDATLRLLAVR